METSLLGWEVEWCVILTSRIHHQFNIHHQCCILHCFVTSANCYGTPFSYFSPDINQSPFPQQQIRIRTLLPKIRSLKHVIVPQLKQRTKPCESRCRYVVQQIVPLRIHLTEPSLNTFVHNVHPQRQGMCEVVAKIRLSGASNLHRRKENGVPYQLTGQGSFTLQFIRRSKSSSSLIVLYRNNSCFAMPGFEDVPGLQSTDLFPQIFTSQINQKQTHTRKKKSRPKFPITFCLFKCPSIKNIAIVNWSDNSTL
jgi:hypothetical protein